MAASSTIEINLSAIARNVAVVRRIVGPDCHLCPVVKADAYGLGAGRIARHLSGCDVRMLAVYTAQQATDLLRGGISGDILVLMPVRTIDRTEELYRGLIRGRLHFTACDLEHVESLGALADHFGCRIPIHLELDTGMHRGGCDLDQASRSIAMIADHPRLGLAGLMTHFAAAESDEAATDDQHQQLEAFIAAHESTLGDECLIHEAASFGLLRNRRYHRTMVRFGLAWAGYGLESLAAGSIVADGEALEPAITWSSCVEQVKVIPEGGRVGYGRTWRAARETRLGLVPVGYADGYPINAGATDDQPLGAEVLVDGGDDRYAAPVVGAVSMDQVTVDLTDVPDVRVGTRVEMITPDVAAPNHLPRLAALAGTIPHEMITRLSSRLPRVYRSAAPPEVVTVRTTRTAV